MEPFEILDKKLNEIRVEAYNYLHPKVHLGINGHPFTQTAYKGNFKQQGDIIRSMGMDAYRFDVKVDVGAEMMRDLYLNMKGVELYPMLYLAGLSLTNQDQYKKGYETATTFCSTYAPYFKTVELGNELENKIILSSAYDGTKLDHYDLVGLKAITSYLKGMVQGVKDVGHHKIIINGNWLHFAFIQYLRDNGVDFDILSWHWYDNQDVIRKKATTVPIEDTLFSKFGKPLIFNEVGVRNEGKLTDDDIAPKLQPLLARLQASKNVKKVFIYELFKQPERTDIWEREYGIYRDVNTPTKVVDMIKSL